MNYLKYNDDFGRWYVDGSSRLLSVTTILDKGTPTPEKRKEYYLKNDKATVDANLKQAGMFGTQAHEYFEKLLKGQEFNPLETHLDHVELFRTWINSHNVKPIELEKTVYSEEFGYAGTCDFIGHYTTCADPKCCRSDIGESLVVADWKTSNQFSITFGWQLAAYRYAAIEMDIVGSDVGMIGVQLPRMGGAPKTFRYEHYDFCFKRFLGALDMVKGMYFNQLNKLEWPYLKKDALIINRK